MTNNQFWELKLGPPGPDNEAFTSPHTLRRSAFENPFLRRAAWYEHREELMEFHTAGQRPWGFWEFEVGEHPRRAGLRIVPIPYGSGGSWEYEEYESDEDALGRLGLLEPWEKAEIKARTNRKGANDDDDPDG